MPYAIRLPDGTLIQNIPDEVTPEQAKQKIISAGLFTAPAPEPAFAPPPPPPPEGGFFPSVKRGFLQTGMLLGDVLPAMVGKAVGAEEYAKKQWEEAAETQKRIEKEVPAAVPSYKDISGFGDAWVYAKEAVGESLASIIPSLLTGGAAGLLARPAVAAANTAAREAAEKTLMSAAMKMGPPTEVALESAKKAAVQAGIDAAKRTAFRYEVAGGFAGSAAQNIPEVYQNIKEETGKEDIPAALVAGGFNAALDTILPAQILKKIRGQGLSETEVMAAWYKRGAKGLGKGFLMEGATEAAQEASSILAENFVAENSDVFSGKNLERVINAGIKGGLGGGVITAATDIATGKAPPPEQTDRQRIEQLQREILGDIQTARSEKALEEAENAKKAAEDAEAARKEAERAPTVPELITIAQGQNAYSALEAEKQRLLGQQKKTKEVKEAIEVIKELQGRLVIEDITRRAPSVPAEMDDKTIRSLGFVKSENPESVYQQLLGKSTRDPDVTAFLKNYAETKAKPQTKDRINTFLGRVERAQIPLTAEEIAEGERRAGETVTEPSRAGPSVVGEPGAGAPAAGVGVTQPSGVVPPVAPVGEPPVGEGVQPAPVAQAPVTPPAPPAELLISLPPRLQNITPAERDLYNFNQSLVEAQTPITGFDFERISDAPSPDGRGMTPESLVLSLEGTLGAVKDLDGKLRSKNRTGATVSQLIDQWKTASQIQARINQSKQDNPELWSNYATRQKELGGLKVGDLIQIETGEIGKLDAKFPKNWRIVFDESTPGILAGTKLLRPKEALRPAPAPTPAAAPAPTAAPTIITAEQLIGFGVKKTQPMIRRIAGKNMDVPADRANVLTELNKYINNKDNSPESRENLAKFRDQFEEVGKTVTVAPTKAKKAPKTVMESALLARINAVGGLDLSLLSEFSERKETGIIGKDDRPLVRWINPMIPGFGKLFRSGGMQDYGEIARVLEEAGYMEPGSVQKDPTEAGERAKKMILSALKKEDAGQTISEMEEEARRRMEELSKMDQEAFDAENKVEFEAERQAIAEAEGLTPTDLDVLEDNIPFLTDAVEQTPERLAADMRAMGFTEEEISDAIAEFSRKAVAAQAPEARAEEAPQTPAAPKAAEELELEAPTAEELAARQKREEDAREAERAEQKRLEQKGRADAERGEFVLTGSDRPADVAAAAGQMDIFTEPSPATDEALAKPDSPKKGDEVSGAIVADALDNANLTPEETQRLESAFNAKAGSKPFLDRLVQEVQKYITKGAQSVAKNLRESIGKIVKAVLGIAVVFNVSTAFPVKQIYAQPQVPAIDVTSAEQLFSSTLNLNGRTLSPNALRVANWIANNAKKDEISLVLDTQAGKLIVMKGPKIISDAPALFGKGGVEAINDRILQMSTDRMEDADRITPAGKFPAKMEKDATYGSTITFFPAKTGSYAIHRVYLGTPAERRAERLATSSAEDNNISYGCVNVSSEFYDNVLAKLDLTGEANAYLLPSDPKKLEQFFPTVPKYSLAEAVKPPSVTLSKETQAKIDELSGLLQKMLGKMGLKNVALNLAQDLERNGEYANRLITLALDATNPVRDLRHESLHAMKELGFFSDAQWATLTKMARDKWIDKYLKSRQSVYNGQAMSRYDAYMRLYNDNEDLIIEEAIADAFGDFDATKAPPGFLQTMLFRMREFFRNIREAMGAANLDSAEDIFRRVEKGELKETAPAVEAPARPSLRAPKTEAFKRWFGDSKVVDAEGKPLVVYHGTGADIAVFDPSKQDPRDAGFWFANAPVYANQYAAGRKGGNVMPVYLSLKNPKIYYDRTTPITPKLIENLKAQGHDGIIRDFTAGPEAWRYAEGQREYAVFQPEQIKSATGNIGTYDVTKPDIRYSLREVPLSTRGLMEVQPIVAMQELGLKTDAVRKPGGIELFNDVRSIALALNQETIRNHGQIAKTDTSLTSEKELARAMVDEIGYQLRATADTGTGWYSDNYPKAVKKLGKLFPELETNPYARTVFSALVAITSNGEKVSLNVKNAIKLYEDIRMGKDPRNIGSRRKNALDNNVAVVMQLMQQYGPAGMRNELLREITVKDMNAILRARGEKPDTSYLADAKVPAAALYFGPKLGAFFSNLEGAEGYLTMDMWWTRTVNRMRGQLESRATEASIKKFAEMMDKPNATRDEVVAATIPLRNKYEEFGWHTELEELVGSKEPAEDKNKPAWTAKAKRKAGSAYQGLLFEHRLEKMANTIYKNEYEMLQELPFTAKDREFMYRTARRAQSLLKAEGINLSLADIQAALWYYEKRLYQHLSGRKADDIGYDEAITQLARESTGPARPSVVFAGQPVPGAGPTGTGAAATGVGGKPAKPSLRDVEGMPTIGPKMDGTFLRRMENIRQQIGDAYISGEIDFEEFHKRYAATNEEYVNALFVQKKIDEAKPAAGLEEVFPGFVFIPEGTKVLATSGLSYPEPTEATVVGSTDIRVGEKAYKFPVVDFGDGRERRLGYGDVKEVFAPRPVKPSLRDVPRANLRDQLNITTLQRIEQTTVAREEKGFVQRITEAISPKNFGFFRQQALNRYEGLSRADRMKIEQMGGVDLLADAGAESAALLSDMGAGVTASALGVHDRKGGAPVYNHYFVVEVNNRALAKRYTSKAQAQAAASAVNGVVRERGYVTVSNFNDSVKGPVLIFAPLMEKYKDPMIFQAFQFYSAAKRGARFMYTLDANGNVIEKLFTADDINIELPRLEAQFPEFKTVHAEWIKYNDKLVDYMRDTGVISEQNAQTFKMHGDYFPFYRQIDGQDDALGPRIFQSISAVKPPKKLKGSELALGDFLENIVRNTQSAVQAGVKNVAARRAAQVGMDVGIVSEIAPGVTPESANSFYVLENGLKKYYDTRDQLFIESIKSLNLPDMPFIGMLAGPANLLRNLVTKDPGFILANLMRDSMSAWATSGVKMTPIVDTMRNFAGALVNQSPEYKALLNAGVIGGYEFSQNIQTSGKEFGAAIRKTAGVPTFGEKIAKPFTSVWETLEKATTASDAATRMEIYKRTLAETGNEAEAIFRALEVMNFNRKGSSAVIRILTAAVPFLNARMQGLDILYRAAIAPTVRGDTSERARQIQKTFFVRGAYLMALSAMYWLLTHDDEDYKKQEQETRDNYWLLPSLGIKIPIPFEVGVLFKVIPERILAYTLGTDTGKDFTDSMKRQLISTLAFNPIPQTALPLVETVTNFSFFTWRPIIPQGLENVAPEYQVGPGTSKLAEGIGKTLKLSPMKIDQIINGYTGTMGMYAVDLMDSIYNTMAESPKPSKRFEQMPVIRRFAVDPEARGTVTAYYDLKNAVDQVVRTENLLERTMDYENWGPYMQENMKLLASKDYVSDMEKTLKELREMKTLIRASTMSADAKRDSIKQIGQMENALTANIQQLKKMFRE